MPEILHAAVSSYVYRISPEDLPRNIF
mgnify:CR=1